MRRAVRTLAGVAVAAGLGIGVGQFVSPAPTPAQIAHPVCNVGGYVVTVPADSTCAELRYYGGQP